uniref:Arachidonate 12-lipoxygenase n=1 Tax=Callorhinchus milii TaxID=7868 RepID=A0A4W3I5Y1_CALMI
MFNYRVTVATGTSKYSGTNNYIYITLVGERGESRRVNLDRPFCNDLERGSVGEYEVGSEVDLGAVLLVKLDKEKFLGLEDDWFCLYVTVTTPGGDTRHFPCYRWLSEEARVHIREGPGKSGLGELYLKKLVVKMDASWDSLQDFERIFWRVKSPIGVFVRENWQDDCFFAYQFLNGCNPCMIQKCWEIPKKFPVTDEMVRDLLPGTTLQQEIKKGNIFLVDYELLEGVPANVIQGKQQFLAAPICLLYQPPSSPLIPIAIQLSQTPGCHSPIFLPSDGSYDWLLAKLWVRSSDFQVHQIINHLCWAHLVGEVFCIATLRQLPAVHPIYKLLTPNTRFTLEINMRGRTELLSESGIITKVVASGGPGMVMFGQRGFRALTYRSLCFPENIEERGVGSLRDYYYRDDGLLIWAAIRKYVESVLGLYYLTDQDVVNDEELQAWLTDVVEEGFQELPDIGFSRVFRSREELWKFLTMAIFTCSAQHSALNNGQYDWCCWVPNSPCTMRQPPPCAKGSVTMEKIMATLPDVSQSSIQMAFTWHLGRPLPDKKLLGFFDEEYFTEKEVIKVIQEFREELNRIDRLIVKRNKGLPIKYEYLRPKQIASSINV